MSKLALHIFDSRFENFDTILKWLDNQQYCNVCFQSSEFIGERNNSKKYLIFSNVSTSLKQQGLDFYLQITKMTLVSCLFLHLVSVFQNTKIDEMYISHSNFSSNQIASINGTKFLVDNLIYVKSSAYIFNTTFSNTFYSSGAIHICGHGKAQIISSTFENNTAIRGAALSFSGGSAKIIDCKFSRNKAQLMGGAIQGWNTLVTIDRSHFNENKVDNLVGINVY